MQEHASERRAATVVTGRLEDAGDYGRIVRGDDGTVARIVEARDASQDELAIREFNAGLYVVDRAALAPALAGMAPNARDEVYLTDAVASLDGPVAALVAESPETASGVNDRVELAACEAAVQRRLRDELMRSGVTMPDPSAVYLDAGVTVGADTVLLPGTHLRGGTSVADGCTIGPDAVVVDSVIGAGSRVVSAQVLESELAEGCSVGPFAYLRPGCRLERRAGGLVRRAQEHRARPGRQGAPPLLRRRRHRRRGHQHRRGQHHRQLRRLPQAPHGDRRPRQDRLRLRLRGARDGRRRRDDRGGVDHHRRRARGGARHRPGAPDGHRGLHRARGRARPGGRGALREGGG